MCFATLVSCFHKVIYIYVRMGWHSAVVKKELKNLEWSHSAAGWRKTGVLVEFSDLAFHFSARYTF